MSNSSKPEMFLVNEERGGGGSTPPPPSPPRTSPTQVATQTWVVLVAGLVASLIHVAARVSAQSFAAIDVFFAVLFSSAIIVWLIAKSAP